MGIRLFAVWVRRGPDTAGPIVRRRTANGYSDFAIRTKRTAGASYLHRMSTAPPPTSRLPVHRSPVGRPTPRVPLRDISQTAFPPASREIPGAPEHRARDWPFIRGLVIADLVATFIGIGLCLGVAPHVESTL